MKGFTPKWNILQLLARPKSGDGKGLFERLQRTLQIFGISVLNVEN